jgi:outer membrane receptor for ferrienterochelin and colicins
MVKKSTEMKTFLIVLGVSLLFINLIFSQKKTENKIKTEQLDEVIVTAQYAPQSENNAIYKVKVINAKTINRKAANNLRELLQQELNISLTQNSVFGSSIEIQGISKENIKILIDGVPVIGRLNGVIDLNQINLSAIERVEIIEGPVSVFYGTDAMGGVINLITKKKQDENFEGSISNYYESINAISLNSDVGYKFGKNTFRFNGGYYHFNGLSTNNSPRNLNWEERGQSFGNLMFNRNIRKLKLRYNVNFSNEKLSSVGEPSISGKIYDKDYYTQRIDNYLSLQGKVSDDKFIDVVTSYSTYQRYHNTFDVNLTNQESVISTTDTKADNIVKFDYGGMRAQLGKSTKADKLNYAYGTEYYSETTEGNRILNNQQNIQTLALFGSLNYKVLKRFEIQPSARYTWNSSYGSLISPAMNAKLYLSKQSQLQFSYARGFRAPSLKELFLDFNISAGPFTYIISGNENLDVEKSHSFNLYYTFRKNLNDTGQFSVEPSVFYNDIANLVALSEMVDFKRTYININKFKSIGGKIDVGFQPNDFLSLKTGFSVIGRYNKYTETMDTEKFLYSPEATTNISFNFKRSNLFFVIFYKYTGKRDGFYIDSDDNLVKTTRNSFNTLDTTLTKSLFKDNFNISLGVKNVFNVTDIQTLNEIGEAHSRDLQLWGRSFYLKTTINFENN